MMKTRKTIFAALGATFGAVLCYGPQAAHAQGYIGSTEWYYNVSNLGVQQYSQQVGLQNYAIINGGLGPSKSDRAVTVRQGQTRINSGRVSTGYKPVVSSFAKQFAGNRGAEIESTYNLYLSRFRDAQKSLGFGTNDVASALAIAFAAHYEIYTSQVASDPQTLDLAKQFRASLLKDAYFQGTDDRYRQLLDENTAVQTVASLVIARDARKRGDLVVLTKMKAESLNFLDNYWTGGTDEASRIRLTATGFRD